MAEASVSPRIDEVMVAVARHYRVPITRLLSSELGREVSVPRQMAYLICHRMTGRSLSHIGRKFRRDHTTVRYGIAQAQERVARFKESAAALTAIEAALSQTQPEVWRVAPKVIFQTGQDADCWPGNRP